MPTSRRARKLAVLREMGTHPNPPRSPQWKMFEMKTYEEGYIYILDHDLNYLQHADRTARVKQHEERCLRVGAFFDSYTPYQVAYVNCATKGEWDQYWDAELATKTQDDLIIIYYHGNAPGNNEQYQWKFQRGLTINAHDFITKVNGGVSDCAFFLDCNFHNRMTRGLKWKLGTTAMTEFITSPVQQRNGAGAIVDHEGDWSKAFVRNMMGFMDGDIQVPRSNAPLKSIPTIMSKDHTIFYNQGSRFKVERREGDPGIVRRLVVDPVMVWSTGQYQFFGKQVKCAPEEVDEPAEEAEPEDEGMGLDLDAADQYVLDQENREQDIADGNGGGSDHDQSGEEDQDEEPGGMFLD